MKANENELVKSYDKKQLTAKGLKLRHHLTEKAAKINGLNIYSKEFRPIKERINIIFDDLVFNNLLNYNQINEYYKSIDTNFIKNGIYSQN